MNLHCCKGNVVKFLTGNSKGCIRLDGIASGLVKDALIDVVSLDVDHGDNSAPISTIGNAKYIYTIGTQFVQISVSIRVYFGKDQQGLVQLKKIKDYFMKKRSFNQGNIVVSIAEIGTYDMCPISIKIGHFDLNVNSVDIIITGLLDDSL